MIPALIKFNKILLSNIVKAYKPKDSDECQQLKCLYSVVNVAFSTLTPQVFHELWIDSERAGSCLPDVVFDAECIGKMAELVKKIQGQETHTLTFKVTDCEDKSTEGMIK